MSNWLNLEGRVVIVTGGASGIGKHVVSCLQAAGANAVIVDMSVKTGDEIDGAYCVACNVTDPASVQAMADAVVAKYGTIDAVVNNAGINMPRLLVDVQGEHPEYELSVDSFDKMFGVNVHHDGGAALLQRCCGILVAVEALSLEGEEERAFSAGSSVGSHPGVTKIDIIEFLYAHISCKIKNKMRKRRKKQE